MLRFRIWTNWVSLPAGHRLAGLLAVVIMLASGTLLFQPRTVRDAPLSAGGDDAVTAHLADPAETSPDGAVSAAPATADGGRERSAAVLRAPATTSPPSSSPTSSGWPLPSFGRYVFAVDGYEQGGTFGSRRSYPAEMTMSVSDDQPADPGVPPLADDELVYDLEFSRDHEELAVVAYRREGIVLTYEASEISFGFTQDDEYRFEPGVLQVPVPLEVGERRTGTSQARGSNGAVAHTEDWTVEIAGVEQLTVMGEPTDTWIVQVDRRARDGDGYTKTRRYWFSPSHVLWVKWEERAQGSSGFGSYSSEYTATLSRFEPQGS